MPTYNNKPDHRIAANAKRVLLGALLFMTCFGVLPLLASVKSVNERIIWLESKRINGGATFYTDHEFLETILKEREQLIGN